MRPFAYLILLVSSTGLASPNPAPVAPTTPPATTGPALTKIELVDMPDGCIDVAKLANSTVRNQALSARISLASCLIDQQINQLVLCDCEQSVREIETIAEPSLRLLDEVFTVGDATIQILARHAQGDLLTSLATRMLSTVPPPVGQTEQAVALRDVRLQMLTPLITPWQARARAAFAELDRIARANPQLAKNVAVASAVRASRAKLSAEGVAKR